MNPTPTPHNAQPPQWRKITKEDPPQWPCWIYGPTVVRPDKNGCKWFHFLEELPAAFTQKATHWHPDQHTPPQESPAETATPTLPASPFECENCGHKPNAQSVSDHNGDCEKCGDAVITYTVDAARYILALRAQLKSMTDQFLAVSGQLGEANKLLREVLAVIEQRGVGHVVMYSDRITPLLPRIRKALAQSDSPGAGVKGEKL